MYTLYKKIETWLEGICEDCVKNEIKNFDSFALINQEKHYNHMDLFLFLWCWGPSPKTKN